MSDVSDIEQGVADQSDIEQSITGESEVDQSVTDESDTEDDVDEEVLAGGFIDAEAVESEEESEDDVSISSDVYFPQFMKFPPEIRELIWESFDPDLKTNKILRFEAPNNGELWESAWLHSQTAPARAMLATHSESRAIALKHYPDTINLRGQRGIVRYNSETDVILLNLRSQLKPERYVPSLGNVKYLAFVGRDRVDELVALLSDQLRAVYYVSDETYPDLSGDMPDVPSDMPWCASDIAHKYELRYTEEGDNEVQFFFCWLDPEYKDIFYQKRFGLRDVHGVPLMEIVEFESVESYRQFYFGGPDGSSLLDSVLIDRSDEEEDEYESEGIDDATIDSSPEATEDEDDLVVQSGSDEEEDQDASPFNESSPAQDDEPDLLIGDDVQIANFSSPDGTDEEPVRKPVRQKRRIVSSDDEEDSEGEGNGIPSRPAKRSRIVTSDTEDEEDAGNEPLTDGHKDDLSNASQDDNTEEEDEEDQTDEEEPVKAKPKSIFEKLRQFRDDNPVPNESGTDSHTEGSVASGSFDGSSEASGISPEAMDEYGSLQPGEMATDFTKDYSEGGEEEEW